MVLSVADRVKETTTTTGTGTINLAGATAGYQKFIDGIGDTNKCYYVIIHQNLSQWEVGIGTVSAGTPDTLSRDILLASSTGSAITFSAGTKDVFVTFPADTILADRTILTFTATQLLDATHHNKTVTNTGASGSPSGREMELPADPFVGMKVNFYNDSVDGLAIRANSGQKIRIGTNETATAGYVTGYVLGQFITLVALTTTLWVCFEPVQSWSIDS